MAAPAELSILQTDPQFFKSVAHNIRCLGVPSGHDLLVNPFFFDGKAKYREVAVDRGKIFADDVTMTTLTNTVAGWFLLCFRRDWGQLVK